MCNWSEVRLQQGKEEQQYTIAMNWLNEEVPVSIIEKATQISLKKLLEMKQELELQKA